MRQGCEQSFQPLGFSSYMPQYSFQALPTSNVFEGISQSFGASFNTLSYAYNPPPSSSCYRPSLPTQIHDMGHEDEEEDDDNNNTNINDDGNNDDVHAGDDVPQQQQRITRDHPRTKEERGHKIRGQNHRKI